MSAPAVRHPVATQHVVGAAVVLLIVLALLAPHYGYHRDELYFRLLPPAWGYIDQPPLAPLLTRGVTALLGDGVVALRLPAMLAAVASIPVLVLVTREVGGNRTAQALTAWGMAGATLTLLFGHVFLTASLDLVVWPALVLFAVRAVLRDDGRWWVAVGVVAGLSSYNKLLIVVLLAAIALGLAALGPRKWFASPWLWFGVAVAALLAAPNIVYQATNDWPQLTMGAALAEENSAEVRVMMWPMLVLLVGPVLAAFWVSAVVGLFRRPAWRSLRFLAVTLVVVVAFVFLGGSQFYYTAGVLAPLTAMGSVPMAEWARTRRRRMTLYVLLAVNAAGCALASLPLLPVETFGATGLASVNSAAADQVGWETYATQVREAAAESGADAIITSNYGEAGALDRFGSGGVPVSSGHNALWELGGPPADAQTVVVVGAQADDAEQWFERCETVDELDNGVGVDTEEEGEPVRVCTGPVAPWDELWDEVRHQG